MRLIYFSYFACLVAVCPVFAQSTAFVPQGGLTLGIQRTNSGLRQQTLLAWHAALAIESVNNEDDNGSLMMQIGYHVKGSATRFRTINLSGFPGAQFTEEFRYNNISLMLGAKAKKPFGNNNKWYYFGGIRGDYTLSTNIDELASENPTNAVYYPQIGGMNRWMVGATLGGGMEFKFTELVGGELKLSVCPDFTPQINQFQSPPLINPWDPTGQPIIIPAKQIRNIAVELSFGLRLLRKVEYVD